MVVLVHLVVARAGEHDPVVRQVERVEVVAAAGGDLAQPGAVGVDLADVLPGAPDGRIENRIFLPSNDTHGSEMLAPAKLVIGVTTPSGEIGESLYRLLGAQVRLSVSSASVLTNTSASVVGSSWIRSSGALSRQPAKPVVSNPTAANAASMASAWNARSRREAGAVAGCRVMAC